MGTRAGSFGNGLAIRSQEPRRTLPLSRPTPHPARSRTAADAGKDRGCTRHRGSRQDAPPSGARRVDRR